jgi:hypothetical protein
MYGMKGPTRHGSVMLCPNRLPTPTSGAPLEFSTLYYNTRCARLAFPNASGPRYRHSLHPDRNPPCLDPFVCSE